MVSGQPFTLMVVLNELYFPCVTTDTCTVEMIKGYWYIDSEMQGPLYDYDVNLAMGVNSSAWIITWTPQNTGNTILTFDLSVYDSYTGRRVLVRELSEGANLNLKVTVVPGIKSLRPLSQTTYISNDTLVNETSSEDDGEWENQGSIIAYIVVGGVIIIATIITIAVLIFFCIIAKKLKDRSPAKYRDVAVVEPNVVNVPVQPHEHLVLDQR